jgi:hypothetical protein
LPPTFTRFYSVANIDEQGRRHAIPVYQGTISAPENAMQMHPQLLADFATVIEIIDKFTELEFPASLIEPVDEYAIPTI